LNNSVIAKLTEQDLKRILFYNHAFN